MFFRLSALGALPSVCCKRKQPLLSRPCPSPSLSSFFPLLALLMILSSGSFLFVPSVYSLPGRRRRGYIAPPGSGFPLLLSSFSFLSSFFFLGRRRRGYIAPPGSGFPLVLSSFSFLSSFFFLLSSYYFVMHLMEVRQPLLERGGLERGECFHGVGNGHTACVTHT